MDEHINRAHLSWIELSRGAFGQNIESLARLARGRLLAASVKANAYGHGLAEVVQIFNSLGKVDYLTVHSLEEAAVCRVAGWKRPIMVLGPILRAQAEAVLELDVEPLVTSREILSRLGQLSKKHHCRIKTHLKLETGTNRQGITESELERYAAIYHKYPHLQGPHGAATHFANIEDTTRHDYAQYQLANFNRMTKRMADLRIKPTLRHTASSAATILFEKTHFDMVRPGISVYGYWPSKETYLSYRLMGGANDLFVPPLSWKTRVMQIKRLAADSFVGYGCTYRTSAESRIAVLPVGYYDGYDRSLSNRAYVLINGRRAPVRGRLCMNLMMVDVTHIRNVRYEQPAILIGTDGSEQITADDLADWSGTINYEIIARLALSTPRSIVD
jgi:alanine racemase